MKRWYIYILVVAVVLIVPVTRADVADLRPVQTVALYRTSLGYRIETDTQDAGEGTNVMAAFAALKGSAPGILYLDTADYLVVALDAVDGVDDMRGILKKSARICGIKGRPDLVFVSRYLTVHGSIPRLSRWEKDNCLPVLDCSTAEVKFLQKNEKTA